MELNPNHPTTRLAQGEWHKLCFIIMHKLGLKEVLITPQDLESIPQDAVIALNDGALGLQVFLTNTTQAHALMSQEGSTH